MSTTTERDFGLTTIAQIAVTVKDVESATSFYRDVLGMRFLFDHHRVIAEGGAAVGVAALLAGKVDPLEGPVVAVISGANAEPDHVAQLLAGAPAPTL